ncbi:8417_t:CDS:2 [Funneliformis geosporum]|nr:8417_t:CDS:2 [Funneliformis geosporum]
MELNCDFHRQSFKRCSITDKLVEEDAEIEEESETKRSEIDEESEIEKSELEVESEAEEVTTIIKYIEHLFWQGRAIIINAQFEFIVGVLEIEISVWAERNLEHVFNNF